MRWTRSYTFLNFISHKFWLYKANCAKGATKAWTMVYSDPRTPMTLNLNVTNSATIESFLMILLVFLQETINKQGEEIRAILIENAKL